MNEKAAKVGGQGWQPRGATFAEDMPGVWGDWGVASEFGRLRAVLLHRPGAEIDRVTDYNAALWMAPMDCELARRQHDAMADAYRAHGVAIHYIEHADPDKPNSHFVRDQMLMTPEGVIVARPASRQRAGEERYLCEALGRIGVPVLLTVHGDGLFEGADAALAGRGLAFVAQGMRTNGAGADQVAWALRQLRFNVVRIQLPPPTRSVHLDGVLTIVSPNLALYRPELPALARDTLSEHGFQLFCIPEEDRNMPGNVVALAPGNVLMPAGNPHTKRLLEDAGCRVEEVDTSEINKSGGSIHCMTGFLRREEGDR
ncbi:MAG: dimethylarginine dimethylaminohydrolase family protein [Nitrososphaerales archaeon]